jgi:ribonuclease Z
MSFEVTILGSGAALPTQKRNPTAQFISCNNRSILIDCGEGTQTQLRKAGVKIQKISHILISHLHGDHYFGLVGLLSTMHLLGRDQGITVYGPVELELILKLQLEIGGTKLGYSICFVPLNGLEYKCLFQDKLIEIHTFPLKHKLPTNGFLIREKQKDRSIIGDEFKSAGLSLLAIPFFKKGEDYVNELGVTYHYKDFTYFPAKAKSYAFCSDTIYFQEVVQYIKGVTVLYHEATFTEKERERAKKTMHSTAKDAAKIAFDAKVGKLLLGHLSARFDDGDLHIKEASEFFENVEVVADLNVFRL